MRPASDRSTDAAQRRTRLRNTATRTGTRNRGRAPNVDPRQIDRYAVRRRLGVGGMSVVYEALDERLDRPVALKLMILDDGERDRARLLREAQALARLSHPNVVEVFEIGEHDGKAFVAMELVEGHTLDRWLRLRRRSSHEIVELFIQAGQGLAAAHEQGLVHRDFKPGNVLVGKGGRARVADFGLVRESTGDDPSSESAPAGPRPDDSVPAALSDPAWDKTLTRTGSLVGTPAYMSPEQIAGRPAGPASDQFSFCVALFEALFGQHPFVAGDDWKQLPTNVLRGLVQRPSGSPRSTSALTRILDRGLQVDPKDRWPSMREVLEQLHRVQRPRRSRVGILGLTAGVAVLAGMLGLGSGDPSRDRCRDAAQAMRGVWTDDARTDLQQTWHGSGLPDAVDTWARAEARLVVLADDWWSVHRHACESPTRSVGTAACLQRQAESLGIHLDVIGDPDEGMIHNVVPMIDELPRPDRCGDAQRTAGGEDLLDSPAWAAQLDEIDARMRAGQYDEAITLTESLVRQADREGTPRLSVEVGLRLGELQHFTGEFDAAARTLEEAYLGAKSLGLDEHSAEAAIALLRQHGELRYRAAEAKRWEGHARAEVERLDDPVFSGSYLNAAGRALRSGGDLEGALALHRRALKLHREHLPPEHPATAWSLFQVGSCLGLLGRAEEGLAMLEESRAMYQEVLGPRHPRVSAPLTNIGVFQMFTGNDADALETFEQVLELQQEAFSRAPLYSRFAYTNISGILQRQGRTREAAQTLHEYLGRYRQFASGEDLEDGNFLELTCTALFLEGKLDEALRHCKRAVAAYEQAHGTDDPSAAQTLGQMADIEHARGNIEQAIAHREQAAATYRKIGQPNSVAESEQAIALLSWSQGDLMGARERLGRTRSLLAESDAAGSPTELIIDSLYAQLLVETGEIAEGRQLAVSTFATLEALWGPDNSKLVRHLSILAAAELASDNPEPARRHAERAVSLAESEGTIDTPDGAWARFTLAKTLVPGQRARALGLARAARAKVAALGLTYRQDLEQIDRWLAAHGEAP